MTAIRILGLDPGLRHTGWGVIEADGSRLTPIAEGTVRTDAALALSDRLAQIYDGIWEALGRWEPHEAACEQTFVNKNPASTLKLGQARGVALVVPARAGIAVAEYPPRLVKKAVVGAGAASKEQVQMMIRVLLPAARVATADAADALAVAVCHAHLRTSPGARAAPGGTR